MWVKELRRYIIKEEVHIANKPMKDVSVINWQYH